MTVGSIVMRSYVWKPAYLPGLVVNEEIETVKTFESDFTYEQIMFDVLWADNTMSREMSQELIDFKEAMNEKK